MFQGKPLIRVCLWRVMFSVIRYQKSSSWYQRLPSGTIRERGKFKGRDRRAGGGWNGRQVRRRQMKGVSWAAQQRIRYLRQRNKRTSNTSSARAVLNNSDLLQLLELCMRTLCNHQCCRWTLTWLMKMQNNTLTHNFCSYSEQNVTNLSSAAS